MSKRLKQLQFPVHFSGRSTIEAIESAKQALRRLHGSALVSALIPSLVFVYAGYERRWAGDDGFINLRVVSQLLDGNGFVFNAGERTEAVTSPGWVLVLWLLGELGFNLDSTAWVLSLLLSGTGMLLACLAAARVTALALGSAVRFDTVAPNATRVAPTLVLPLGALAYAALPVAWDYETSALENGLGLAWLGAAYWLMVGVTAAWQAASSADDAPPPRERVARGRYATAALLGCAPLVRPDFVLYAAPLIVLLLAATPGLKPRAWLALAAALPGGGFQIFRMGYFASLVPNTAIAKEAFEARWDQGLLYFDNTYVTYELGLPLALVALALAVLALDLVRARRVQPLLVPLSLALSGALHLVYVVRVGGDFMHGRMLLPGLFAIFASVAVVRVHWGSWLERSFALALVAACAVTLNWGYHCALERRPTEFVHGILDERHWWSEYARQENPTHLEQYRDHQFYKTAMVVKQRIAEGCPAGLASLGDDIGDICKRVAHVDAMDGLLIDHGPSDLLSLEPKSVARHIVAVFAFRPLGIAGRVLGLRVNLTDSFGLADPLASRMQLESRGRPGHEKLFSTVWFAAKYAAPGATHDGRVQIAKQALDCGLLRALTRATRDELTVERFLRNLRLAFKLHTVRVPSDPKLAVARFCKG